MLYPQFQDFPNQVFITKRNGNNVDPKLNGLLKRGDLKVTNVGSYSNRNAMENDLNQKSKTFQKTKELKIIFHR